MERLNKAMAAYVRAISKRSEGEDKEKLFPIGNLGGVMVAHGEDFASNSEYGQCLTGRFSVHGHGAWGGLGWLTDIQLLEGQTSVSPEYRSSMSRLQPLAG